MYVNTNVKMTRQEVEEETKVLEKIFDVVRILDGESLSKMQENPCVGVQLEMCKCYEFWKKNKPCENCISVKAYTEKRQKTKLELFDTDIYLVISRYMEIDDEPCVMELVRYLADDTLIDTDGRDKLVGKLKGYQDKLYRTVADAINHCIRKTDKLVRYGGDEFLLILPNMVRGTLRGKLLQIQEAIQNAKIPECSRLRLTASIGGVLSENETIDEAIERADHLMYKAKDHKAMVVTECDKKMPDDEETKNKPRIMIVDDSEFNRAILSEILQEDYEIVEAESGREALHKLGEYGLGISLVLLDIIMPEMDGFEVLKHMTEEDWISNVPVIMISSEDSENYIRRAYEMGVTDYINRPFDANIVYQRVSNTVKLYAKQRRLMALVT